MSDRHPYDGEPYYCAICGVGLGEFMACEEADCCLETPKTASERRELRKILADALDAARSPSLRSGG